MPEINIAPDKLLDLLGKDLREYLKANGFAVGERSDGRTYFMLPVCIDLRHSVMVEIETDGSVTFRQVDWKREMQTQANARDFHVMTAAMLAKDGAR